MTVKKSSGKLFRKFDHELAEGAGSAQGEPIVAQPSRHLPTDAFHP
jgi:hypothetical protein